MAVTVHNAALGAFAAFFAWTFIIHWAPVFRWIGYAFAAGALTTTLAFAALVFLSARRPEEFQYSGLGSTAAFVSPGPWERNNAWLNNRQYRTRQALAPSSFVVSEALNGLLSLVLRDFVTAWYGNISRSGRFEAEIDRAVRAALSSIRHRAARLDVVEFIVSRLAPLITAHLRDFDEAERVVRGKKLERVVTESEELDLAIAARYRNGRLHPAASLASADAKLIQQEYLRKIVTQLVPEVLPEELLKSRVVLVFVQEIVTCAILGEAMRMLADPDVWNRVLEAYGRTVLQDRKTVRKLRAALDEHASPAPKSSKLRSIPVLKPHDDERRFERFIRAIRQCDNLSDARRFRSEVASQLRKESMLEGQDPTYLRRLETGKRALDQRVGKLSAVGVSTKLHTSNVTGHREHWIAGLSLMEILHNASGLSYFMEYMDRQRLMSLVQFWIVVDGFRNPLEDDALEEESALESHSHWRESDRMDIAQIAEAYLSKPELMVPNSSRTDVKAFLRAGQRASPLQYSKARSAILKAQTAALQEMQEKYFPKFKSSDLFYKFLSSEDGSAKSQSRLMSKTAKNSPVWSIAESADQSQPSSQPMSRVNSGAILKRTANSSNDLRSSIKSIEEPAARMRRSLDASGPLFDDDVEPETMNESTNSFDVDSSGGLAIRNEEQMVEAMEVALNTIMTDGSHEDGEKEPLFGDLSVAHSKDSDTASSMNTTRKNEAANLNQTRERPNLASLGLVTTSSRIGVFSDNDLFGDEEKFPEDERADSDEFEESKSEDEIHEAAPGDLGLAEAISALTVDIDRLIAQESVVDTLTRKADLTNNLAELRILGKSKSSLQREIRRKELQRQQYIVQESDNSLYGRASIEIKQIMVGKELEGQEFALYVVEVRRKAGEHMSAASWAVARRYSEFHDLHQRLRQVYPAVRSLDFPRRRLVMKLQRDFLHRRRVSLERYLRELLRLPEVCQSRDLRAFLSQQAIISNTESGGQDEERADIVSRIYNSVADGMDDFLGNIPVLDQLSVAGQNLISAATSQYVSSLPSTSTNDPGDALTSSTISATVSASAEAQAELDAYDKQHDFDEPFVKPICDLFLETFELNRSVNWLRGRAVVVVLHQLLGGTVERKIRDTARSLASDANVLRYVDLARESLWPEGAPMVRGSEGRTDSQKKASKREAGVVLAALVPDLAGSVVGRANATAAARKIAAAVNNQRLNAHLAFVLLDEVVAALFPESATIRGRDG